MLERALQKLLEDESHTILLQLTLSLKWLVAPCSNSSLARSFIANLITNLKECLKCKYSKNVGKVPQIERNGYLFSGIISLQWHDYWELIKEHFIVLPTSSNAEVAVETLSREEENAFHYTAGYVIRALHKRATSNPESKELTLCLLEMLDDQYSDNEKDYGAWMKLIDREGLKHVNNYVHSVFVSMERSLRQGRYDL